MRPIKHHRIQATDLNVVASDQPGHGGANHVYDIFANGEAPMCTVRFQNGPIRENGVNGVTHEALLAIVIDRLQSFQAGPFPSRENAIALTKLQEALMWLQQRTRDRIARSVEGESKA